MNEDCAVCGQPTVTRHTLLRVSLVATLVKCSQLGVFTTENTHAHTEAKTSNGHSPETLRTVGQPKRLAIINHAKDSLLIGGQCMIKINEYNQALVNSLYCYDLSEILSVVGYSGVDQPKACANLYWQFTLG